MPEMETGAFIVLGVYELTWGVPWACCINKLFGHRWSLEELMRGAVSAKGWAIGREDVEFRVIDIR